MPSIGHGQVYYSYIGIVLVKYIDILDFAPLHCTVGKLDSYRKCGSVLVPEQFKAFLSYFVMTQKNVFFSTPKNVFIFILKNVFGVKLLIMFIKTTSCQ